MAKKLKNYFVSLGSGDIKSYRPGDILLLSGKIYTARDQAHRKMVEEVESGNKKRFSFLEGAVIYYCGPSSFPEGRPVGSCGPTSSFRMDRFLWVLGELGVVATIGKGERSRDAIEVMKRFGIRYLVAPGGAGAYLSNCVVSSRLVLFGELGPEAIYEFTIKDFPVLVAV